MKAPYQAYRLLVVREAYQDDHDRLCDECGFRLGLLPPIVVAGAPMRLDPARPHARRRFFHLDCYFGYHRWPRALRQGEAKSLFRWANDFAALVRRLRLDAVYPRLARVDELPVKVAHLLDTGGGKAS